MKLLVFGQPESYVGKRDLARLIERLQESGHKVEQHDGLSRDSVALMELYGVVTSLGYVVVGEDGSVHGLWQHTPPSYEDLAHTLGPPV